MAQEVFLRTAAGIISADKFNDNISPFKPTRHGATAVFIKEEQYLNPQTSPALGTTVRFEVNKDGDYLNKVWLVVSLQQLAKNAGATFARYCDWIGYAIIREFRAIYGPIICQRLRKEALFLYAQRFLADEEYVHNARMVGGGLDNASRISMATKPQYLKIPLHLLWINSSPTQCLCIQALGNRMAFEVRFTFIHYTIARVDTLPRALSIRETPRIRISILHNCTSYNTTRSSPLHILSRCPCDQFR
jgi:hypothetical protein